MTDKLSAPEFFVGRDRELDVFRSLLRDTAEDVRVLCVHGPGGIGKTALLRAFAVEARAHDRHVRWVETAEPGTVTGSRPPREVSGGSPVVLVDSTGSVSRPEAFVKDRIASTVPAGSLVVVARREAPSLRWRTDPAWAGRLRSMPLAGLSPESSALLAETHRAEGVPVAPVLAFADGHPLALMLAASAAPRSAGPWEPSPDVLRNLLAAVVGTVPSRDHGRALEVCAHALDTTEDLLAAVLPDVAHETFVWLRNLPYIQQRRFGLRLIAVVREAVDQDLRWRAPEQYLTMHRAMRRHLEKTIVGVSEPASLRAAAGFNHIQGRGPWLPSLIPPRAMQEAYETAPAPEDIGAVIDLAARVLGAEAAALVEFWLHRQPHGFHLYHAADSGRLTGFLALLRFGRWDAAEVLVDPVVAAVRRCVEDTSELALGEHVLLARFHVHEPEGDGRPAVLSHTLARTTRELLRAHGLAWYFVAPGGPSGVDPLLRFADLRPFPDPLPGRGQDPARTLLHGRDWRDVRHGSWSELLDTRMLFGPKTSTHAGPLVMALSRGAFDRAVHDALRAWNQTERFLTNPLLNSWLVVRSGTDDREGELRRLLGLAVDALDADNTAQPLGALLRETYMAGGRTQTSVAREMPFSFSTYRRLLKQAVDKVCRHLWQYERDRRFTAGQARGDAPTKVNRP